jgi:hypothetical protein
VLVLSIRLYHRSALLCKQRDDRAGWRFFRGQAKELRKILIQMKEGRLDD